MDPYSQYDISECDPYLIEGSTCLVNSLGFTDTVSLNEAEEEISAVAMGELEHTPVHPTFDLEHLKNIHSKLFGDVYPFAGQVRKCEIAKGGALFLPYKLIEREADACFESLKQENYLVGLSMKDFGQRAGYYLGWVNRIHFAREGNGRTQRILINQLGRKCGFRGLWSEISKEGMGLACREARTFDNEAAKLQRLLSLHIQEY